MTSPRLDARLDALCVRPPPGMDGAGSTPAAVALVGIAGPQRGRPTCLVAAGVGSADRVRSMPTVSCPSCATRQSGRRLGHLLHLHVVRQALGLRGVHVVRIALPREARVAGMDVPHLWDRPGTSGRRHRRAPTPSGDVGLRRRSRCGAAREAGWATGTLRHARSPVRRSRCPGRSTPRVPALGVRRDRGGGRRDRRRSSCSRVEETIRRRDTRAERRRGDRRRCAPTSSSSTQVLRDDALGRAQDTLGRMSPRSAGGRRRDREAGQDPDRQDRGPSHGHPGAGRPTADASAAWARPSAPCPAEFRGVSTRPG